MSFSVKGNYGRMLCAKVDTGTCDSCNENKIVLIIDGSAGEYGNINLCFSCIKNLFKKGEEKSEKSEIQQLRDEIRQLQEDFSELKQRFFNDRE